MTMKKPVAQITLTLMDNGAMSIEGNVGDVNLALGMLDAAKAAVGNRLGRPSILEPHGAGLDPQIVVPNREVNVRPNERVYKLPT